MAAARVACGFFCVIIHMLYGELPVDRSELRRALEQVRDLPVHPHVLARMLDILSEPAPVPQVVARIAFSDPALAAALIHACAPGVLAQPDSVPTPLQAVERAGIARIRSLVLRMALPLLFDTAVDPDPELDLLWRRSLASAHCCSILAERIEGVAPHEAYLAGLLHDLGDLAVHAVTREEDTLNGGLWIGDSGMRTWRDEGADHALAGKWLAERWQFPDRLLQVVWLHHHDASVLGADEACARLVDLVSLADAIAEEIQGSDSPGWMRDLPDGLLARLNLTATDCDALRRLTAEQVRARADALALRPVGLDAFRQTLRAALQESVEVQARGEDDARVLHRRASQLQALTAMQRRLRPGTGLDATLDAVADAVRKGFQITPGVCCAADSEGRTLRVLVWRDLTSPPARTSLDLKDASGVGHASEAAPVLRALQALGLGVDGGVWAGAALRDISRWEGLAAVPMLAGDRCQGQLLFDTASGALSGSDETFSDLMTFASVCGSAIARCMADERATTQNERLVLGLRAREPLADAPPGDTRLARVGEYAAGAAQALNAPLNLAAAQLQWLAGKAPDGSQRQELESIARHMRSARDTVRDLLYLARPPQPRHEPVMIHFLLHQLLTNVRDQLADKGIRIVEDMMEGLPRVHADKRQMEHLFVNLITSAFDAMSSRGGVLTVQTRPTPDRMSMSVKVSDTGPGLNLANPGDLFEPFASLQRHGPGAGMGLAVCRDIVRAHGGEIDAFSDPDLGTAITLILPVSNVETPQATPEPQADDYVQDTAPAYQESGGEEPPAVSVLVADDDPNVRKALREAMSARGYRVVLASNGDETIAAIVNQQPDLVLLDLRMPGSDSLAILDRLRERHPQIPVIAMTASSHTEDDGLARARGAQATVKKPFQLKQLMTLVDEVSPVHGPAR
jgi:signal transduction histidine kinase/CheY-like chemotaxis protein/HD-like signal output (HDOD) protein